MVLAEKIKYLCNFKGLTPSGLGKKVGISHTMMGRIIKGQSSPTYEVLEKIAAGLEIPLYLILTDENMNFKTLAARHKDMWRNLRKLENIENELKEMRK
jgi:transcriptional regulator with XRE-family HTH domain